MATLTSLVADKDPSRVTELEVIFTDLGDEGADVGWAELRSVQSLTLVATRLHAVPAALGGVGGTLRSLTLAKQHLSRMSGLERLGNLTELSLTGNNIAKIEGLEGCPKVRRLWLSDNRIAKLEGLYHLGDLRELCVQGNAIKRLSGLEANRYLRVLDLSRNDVAKVEELERLAHLGALRELHLQSDLFGACPVVHCNDYRTFALCALKHLRELDGAPVKDADRAEAEDDFLQRQLAFNDEVEALRAQHHDELRDIELSRLRSEREAETTKAQLFAHFSKLQLVVSAGREKVQKEQARQMQLREQNLAHLKAALATVRAQHRNILDSLIEDERRKASDDEALFARQARRARFELNESLALAELSHPAPGAASLPGAGAASLPGAASPVPVPVPGPGPGRVAFQVVYGEELKLRAAQVRADAGLHVHRAIRVFNAALYEQLDEANAPPVAQTLYVGVRDLPELRAALGGGLAALAARRGQQEQGKGKGEGKGEGGAPAQAGLALALCTSAGAAAARCGACSDMRSRFRVLQCRAYVPASRVVVAPHVRVPQQRPAGEDGGKGDDDGGEGGGTDRASSSSSLGAVMDELCLAGELAVACGEQRDVLLVRAAHVNTFVVASMYLVLSSAEAEEEERAAVLWRERMGGAGAEDGVPAKVRDKLAGLERQIEGLVEKYEERLRHEMDPETAEKVEGIEASVDGMRASLQTLRADIEHGKAQQEAALRNF